MPFAPGEQVNLRFVGDAATGKLTTSNGQELTVANGGLRRMDDGALVAILQMPTVPTVVDYTFQVGDEITDRGKLRVVSPGQRPAPPAPEQSGVVRPRRPRAS